jgi:hypothetical protein
MHLRSIVDGVNGSHSHLNPQILHVWEMQSFLQIPMDHDSSIQTDL